MADYKNIPVDQETYDMLVELCETYQRKQGAHVKLLVKADYEALEKVKLVGKKANKELKSKNTQAVIQA